LGGGFGLPFFDPVRAPQVCSTATGLAYGGGHWKLCRRISGSASMQCQNPGNTGEFRLIGADGKGAGVSGHLELHLSAIGGTWTGLRPSFTMWWAKRRCRATLACWHVRCGEKMPHLNAQLA